MGRQPWADPRRSGTPRCDGLVDPVVCRHIGILEARGRSLSPAALALRRIVHEALEQFGQADAVDESDKVISRCRSTRRRR